MAAPTVGVMAVQGLVNAAEVYFVGRLGSAVLAGVSLSYPVVMLMAAMSGGGMGGGVSSAIARALGAGRREEARALVWHALAIAVACGTLFTIAILAVGPWLWSALGGRGEALDAAISYANAFALGVLLLWVFNTGASIYRGAGDMMFPAKIGMWGAIFIVSVSPALIFGLGPFPALGLRGAAWALVSYYALAVTVLMVRLFSARSPLRPPRRIQWSADLFRDILHVGLPSSVSSVLGNAWVFALTGLVGQFGTEALAAFGLGIRLEYILIPVLFGLGTALITLVSMAIGAGRWGRVRAIIRYGILLSTVPLGLLGLILAGVPQAWISLFSADAQVLAAGTLYFRLLGPFYSLLGAAITLYFVSQALGRANVSMWIGAARLAFVLAGGGWASRHWGLRGIFAFIAAAYVLYTAVIAIDTHRTLRRRQQEPVAALAA